MAFHREIVLAVENLQPDFHTRQRVQYAGRVQRRRQLTLPGIGEVTNLARKFKQNLDAKTDGAAITNPA